MKGSKFNINIDASEGTASTAPLDDDTLSTRPWQDERLPLIQ